MVTTLKSECFFMVNNLIEDILTWAWEILIHNKLINTKSPIFIGPF
jgi:hypothetical protein